MSIEVRTLSKSFAGRLVLDQLQLEIPEGKLVALLGPSGSGKTTLLRIIAGLERPDPGGRVLFGDQDVTGRPVGQRGIGFVFQHYALFGHLNVFENVAFGLRVRRRSERPSQAEIQTRVMRLLDLVQLGSFARQRPSELSGGERQRIALARALAVEPKVLLLDEPFGALDAQVRQDLRRWLRHLHEELHVTSLFVTHDQEEALEVADQVVVLKAGKVEQVGAPDEIYHRPQTEFVLSFLGRVDRFDGVVVGARARFGAWDLVLSRPQEAGARSARFFLRPHDWEIDIVANHPSATRALVSAVHSAGPIVRVEFQLDSGGSIQAELSQRRLAALGLVVGSRAYTWPRRFRWLTDDSSVPVAESSESAPRRAGGP